MKRIRNIAIVLVFIFAALTAPKALATTGTWCGNHNTMAVYGGSSATGYLMPGYSQPNGIYQPTEYGWTTNVAERAYDTWSSFTGWRNYSKNGASVATFLPGGSQHWAIQDTANWNINIAFIAMGTNEYLGGVPVATFKSNLNELITRIWNATGNTTSIVIIRQWYTPHRPLAEWIPYVNAMRDVANARHVPYVDIDLWTQMEYGQTDDSGLFHDDKIHLTPAGQTAYAKDVWAALNRC